jgi:hypothetical protein
MMAVCARLLLNRRERACCPGPVAPPKWPSRHPTVRHPQETARDGYSRAAAAAAAHRRPPSKGSTTLEVAAQRMARHHLLPGTRREEPADGTATRRSGASSASRSAGKEGSDGPTGAKASSAFHLQMRIVHENRRMT